MNNSNSNASLYIEMCMICCIYFSCKELVNVVVDLMKMESFATTIVLETEIGYERNMRFDALRVRA